MNNRVDQSQDNCIIAEKGIMTTSDDQRFLEFTLQNGTRYARNVAMEVPIPAQNSFAWNLKNIKSSLIFLLCK